MDQFGFCRAQAADSAGRGKIVPTQNGLARLAWGGIITLMTVITDHRKRVTLPVQPGERFEVRVLGEGQYMMTRLEPLRPAKVTVRKVGRYSVGHVDRTVSEAALREALAEFP